MEEKFFSPREVAELLQIKKNTVYEMIKRGELRAVRLGKQLRIPRTEICRFMGTPLSEEEEKIILCGQDQVLDALCALFNDGEGFRMKACRSPLGSYRGLYEMYHNDNCVATAHLWDSETDTYNLPYVTRMLPGEKLAVYHLLKRWQGFYVREGNPKNIRTFEDLTRKNVRIVNRDRGSGIRVYIDEMCKKLGIRHGELYGYADEVSSHYSAAAAVLRGAADVAVGNEKTCRMMEGLEFIPQKQEDYDIIFREEDLTRPEFQRLLYLIQSDEFRREVEAVSGYDASDLGKRIL